jgi:hypothetical protein
MLSINTYNPLSESTLSSHLTSAQTQNARPNRTEPNRTTTCSARFYQSTTYARPPPHSLHHSYTAMPPAVCTFKLRVTPTVRISTQRSTTARTSAVMPLRSAPRTRTHLRGRPPSPFPCIFSFPVTSPSLSSSSPRMPLRSVCSMPTTVYPSRFLSRKNAGMSRGVSAWMGRCFSEVTDVARKSLCDVRRMSEM